MGRPWLQCEGIVFGVLRTKGKPTPKKTSGIEAKLGVINTPQQVGHEPHQPYYCSGTALSKQCSPSRTRTCDSPRLWRNSGVSGSLRIQRHAAQTHLSLSTSSCNWHWTRPQSSLAEQRRHRKIINGTVYFRGNHDFEVRSQVPTTLREAAANVENHANVQNSAVDGTWQSWSSSSLGRR